MACCETEVVEWAKQLCGASAIIAPLEGGANNHLFRCRGPSRELVIKRYREENFTASVSRRAAEVTFLKYATECAPKFTPELIAVHDKHEMIAISAINGMSYAAGQPIPAESIGAAVEFYRLLNKDRHHVSNYPIRAREAFLSIGAHLRNVEGRISRLEVGHLPGEMQPNAQAILTQLLQRIDAVRTEARIAIAAGDLDDAIDPQNLQISPGDFGFHNALLVDRSPVFFDFEYAGSDDPAKTLADFFLQPSRPIDRRKVDALMTTMAINIPIELLRRRVRMLSRILELKWATIILSPLERARYAAFEYRYGAQSLVEIGHRINLVHKRLPDK